MGQTSPVCPRCGAADASGSAKCPACGHAPASEDAAHAGGVEPPGGAAWTEPAGQAVGVEPPGGATSTERAGDAAPAGTMSGRGATAGTPPKVDRSGSVQVEGQVRGIMARSDGGQGETVWSFRVERYDEVGNRELLVPVEMRGYRFEGSLAEGDWVRLRGSERRGTLQVSEFENVTTGATVRVDTTPRTVGIVAGVIFAVMFSAVVVFMVVMFIRHG